MRRLFLPLLLAGALGAAAAATGATEDAVVVASVSDGDTLTLTSGARVRLLQVDTPELGSGECYSRAARTALLSLVPVGSRVTLAADPELDRTDRYGRLLRYVLRGSVNANVELVRRGAAAPYFYRGERGRHSGALMRAARQARAGKRGLWRACPRTVLDPSRALSTGPGSAAAAAPARSAPPAKACDPNYAGGCVPPPPPDLDCDDIRALGIAPVRVVGADPHRLDRDRDGLGCE